MVSVCISTISFAHEVICPSIDVIRAQANLVNGAFAIGWHKWQVMGVLFCDNNDRTILWDLNTDKISAKTEKDAVVIAKQAIHNTTIRKNVYAILDRDNSYRCSYGPQKITVYGITSH